MTCVTVVPLNAEVTTVPVSHNSTVESIACCTPSVSVFPDVPQVSLITLIPGPRGVQGPQGPEGTQFESISFSPVDGQTQFDLPVSPDNPALTRMWINGQRFRPPTSIVVAANVVTWLSEFAIASTDEIEIEYK